MKNIHKINQNIYITSYEEIKEDYVIAYGVVIKVMMFDKETLYFVNGTKAKREDCKKIILTTDQDLIKDGVQAIDDEFLEWFVNNSSCESVEIYRSGNHYDGAMEFYHPLFHKIIIPKEEAKKVGEYQQELFNYLHDLGIVALQSEMQEIERIVLDMQQEQDKNKYSELVDLLERLTTIYKEDSDLHQKYDKQRLNLIEKFKKK